MNVKMMALGVVIFISLFGFASVTLIIVLRPHDDNSQIIAAIITGMGTLIASILSYLQSVGNSNKITTLNNHLIQQRQDLEKNTNITQAIAEKMVTDEKGTEKAATDKLDAALNANEGSGSIMLPESIEEFQ